MSKTIKNTSVSHTVALGDMFLDYHEHTHCMEMGFFLLMYCSVYCVSYLLIYCMMFPGQASWTFS